MDNFMRPNSLVESKVVDVLRGVRRDYPDAMICGGFLRDRSLGMDPRDVDIITVQDPKEGTKMIPRNGQEDRGSDDETGRLIGVSDLGVKMSGSSWPVQLIFANPGLYPMVVDTVTDFAFGMSQIWSDGVMVWNTKHFHSDMERRVFTVRRCRGPHDAVATYKKYRKLRERFINWPIVVPEQFQDVYAYAFGVYLPSKLHEVLNADKAPEVVEELTELVPAKHPLGDGKDVA